MISSPQNYCDTSYVILTILLDMTDVYEYMCGIHYMISTLLLSIKKKLEMTL